MANVIKLSEIVKGVDLKTRSGGFGKVANSLANFLLYVMTNFETIKDDNEKAMVAKMAAKAQKKISEWGNGSCTMTFMKGEKNSAFYKKFLVEAPKMTGAETNPEISALIATGMKNRKATQEAKALAKKAVEIKATPVVEAKKLKLHQ